MALPSGDNLIGIQAVFDLAEFQASLAEYQSALDQASAKTKETADSFNVLGSGGGGGSGLEKMAATVDAAKNSMDNLAGSSGITVDAIADVGSAGAAAGAAASAGGSKIAGAFEGALNKVKGTVSGLSQSVQGGFSGIAAKAASSMSGLGSAVTSTLGTVGTTVSSTFGTILSGLTGLVSKATGGLGGLASSAGSALSGVFGGAVNAAGTAVAGLGGEMGLLNAAVGVATGGIVAIGLAFGAMVTAVVGATGALVDFIKTATMAASKGQEIYAMGVFIANANDVTTESFNSELAALTELGLKRSEASKLYSAMIRYNLDTSQAVDLARVSLDASAVSFQDVGDVIDTVTKGVVTGRTRALYGAGIFIDAATANKVYAESIGKTVAQLTAQEKSQAAINELIKQGGTIQGAYEASLETTQGQMRELGRTQQKLAGSVGMPFQGVLSNLTLMKQGFYDTVLAATQSGGALNGVLANIAAVASLVTERFVDFGKTAGSAFVTALANAAAFFGNMANQAIEWGANVAIQFASGLIEGASAAIVAALNAIGALVAGFLAPGSPPKILPKLPEWGASAMTYFLKGFTEADFSILEELQGPMKTVFSMLEKTGEIRENKTGEYLADLSVQMAEVISSGQGLPQLLDDIREVSGPFGDELATLTQLKFDAAQADEDLANAEEKLKQAQEKANASQQKVTAGISEYNAMLKKGASKSALQAKLAEINATKKLASQAQKDISTAQTEIDQAKERQAALQKQYELQGKLLDQLTEMTEVQIISPEAINAMKELTDTLKKAAGGGGMGDLEGTLGGGAGTGGALDAVKEALNKKIDEIKANIREKFKGIFTPLIDEINTTWTDAKTKITQKWNEVFGPLGDFLQRTVGPKVSAFLESFKSGTGGAVESAKKWWGEYGPYVGQVFGWTMGKLGEATMASLFWIGKAIRVANDYIGEVVGKVSEFLNLPGLLGAAWSGFKDVMKVVFGSIGDFFKGFVDEVIKGGKDPSQFFAEWQAKLVSGLATAISGAASKILPELTKVLINIRNGVLSVGTSIITWITQKISDSFQASMGILSNIGQSIADAFNNARSTVENAINNIGSAISQKINDIVTNVADFGQKIKDRISAGFGEAATGAASGLSNLPTIIMDSLKNTLAKIRSVPIIGAFYDIWAKIIESLVKISGPLFDAVGRLVSGVARKIAERAIEIFNQAVILWGQFTLALESVVIAVIESFQTFFTRVVTIVQGWWTQLYTVATTAWNALTEAIRTVLDAILNSVIFQWISNVISTIITRAVEIYNATLSAIGQVAAAITAGIATVLAAVGDLITQAIGVISTRVLEWYEIAKTAIANFITGIAESVEAVIAGVASLLNQVGALFVAGGEWINKWVGYGVAVVDGLIRGIGDKAKDLIAAIGTMATDALNALAAKWGIESPAKEFQYLGENAVAGLEGGFTQDTSLTSSIAALGTTALTALTTGLGVVTAAIPGLLNTISSAISAGLSPLVTTIPAIMGSIATAISSSIGTVIVGALNVLTSIAIPAVIKALTSLKTVGIDILIQAAEQLNTRALSPIEIRFIAWTQTIIPGLILRINELADKALDALEDAIGYVVAEFQSAKSAGELFASSLDTVISQSDLAAGAVNSLKAAIDGLPFNKTVTITVNQDGGGGGVKPGDKTCFIAGTRVKTPAGTEQIQNIKVGDEVWAYDFTVKKPVARKVTATITSRRDSLVTMITSKGTVVCSDNHRFYSITEQGWVAASDLFPNDKIFSFDGIESTVYSVEYMQGTFQVYNITVDTDHNYFILDMLVHNVKAEGFARGGRAMGGTTNVVGEEGPELITQDRGAWVIPNYKLRALAAAANALGGSPSARNSVLTQNQSQTVNINFGNVAINNGMDMAAFEARVKRVVKKEYGYG